MFEGLSKEKFLNELLKKNLKVAVVIPCYNVQKHIEGIIDSIPEFVDFVVLVNDASTDRTGIILDKLKEQKKNVFILHRSENGGIGKAVFDGFDKAAALGADLHTSVVGGCRFRKAHAHHSGKENFPRPQGKVRYRVVVLPA